MYGVRGRRRVVSRRGNLELHLDNIIEGRWNDGVVCLKGRFSLLFLYCLGFGGLYTINLIIILHVTFMDWLWSIYRRIYFKSEIVKKNETFVYVFDIY